MPPRAAATTILAFALLSPLAARADDAGADVASLEKQLEDERVALSTSDCNVACRALASIRRAADRICALEPGARCDAARAKEHDAAKRVRDACPDCAIAFAPQPKESQDQPASAPPSPVTVAGEPRGGCRSCALATDGDAAGDLGVLGLAILALTRLTRRRRRAR